MSTRRLTAVVLSASAACSALVAWGLYEISKSFDY